MYLRTLSWPRLIDSACGFRPCLIPFTYSGKRVTNSETAVRTRIPVTAHSGFSYEMLPNRNYRRQCRWLRPYREMAIKDQYDTFDMRTTSGGDAEYANDRPPADATFVKRLRNAGAIILAKANLAEYAVDGARSSFGGTFCNPYDTEREPGMSSAGSASS